MRKLSTLLIASTLAFGAVNLAHAADEGQKVVNNSEQHHPHKGPKGMMHDPMFKDLKLTDAQKQQIRDIMKENRPPREKPNDDNRRIMHELIISDNFDKAQAEKFIAQGAEQHQAHMLARLETQNKIYHILSAEQKKQVNDNFAKHLNDDKKFPERGPAGE